MRAREKVTVGKPSEEGWYTDPYARHEARWLSDGEPTKLVRDGAVQTYDEPPAGPTVAEPVRLEDDPISTGGQDLLRADSAEADDSYDASKAKMAALDALGQDGAPNFGRRYDGEKY
jgi:hypothetical protein